MSNTPEMPQAAPHVVPAVKPRRRWFRFLYQFSLRTMLIGMTLAAVACWWFLQPGVQEEELAGRYLKLRRQVRVLAPVSDSASTDVANTFTDLEALANVSVGSWQLRDDNTDLLVDGRYHNDLPQGKWTLWYPSGRKAAEGEAFRGAKSGLWRVWDEYGTLRSEVTYRAVAPKSPFRQPRPAMTPWTGFGSMGPMMIGGPLGQLGGGGQFLPSNFQSSPQPFIAERHGPCRVWYASGKLQYEGNYADDRRDGAWKFYDEQGNVTEAGQYQADLREGEWTIAPFLAGTKPGSGSAASTSTEAAPGASLLPAKVKYVAGRTQDDHDALLARLRADLASNSVRRQVAAAARLEELGQHALPILHEQLQSGSTEAKILALRILTEHEALSPSMYPQIDPLISDDDPRLALRATLAIYLLSPTRRNELHPRLLELVETSANRDQKLDVLAKMCDANPDQRLATFMRLVEILAEGTITDPGQFDPYLSLSPDWQRLTRLKSDPVPLLAQSFIHREASVRLFILLVLEALVETGEGSLPVAAGTAGNAEITWPIPPTVQAVLDKAKTDPDPAVRQQAEAIGRKPHITGIGSGFF
jgi:hypothetical protein